VYELFNLPITIGHFIFNLMVWTAVCYYIYEGIEWLRNREW